MSFILWFTGLSGAGKSTLARSVEEQLKQRDLRVEVLDGDEVRRNFSAGLGFSREDRRTNILRIGFVARLLARNGVVAITAAISPYRMDRDEVRSASEAPFVEVFADSPLEVLIDRDTKGLYKKALAGEITNFTGINDPYEPPPKPDIHLRTGTDSVSACVDRIVRSLDDRGLLAGHRNEQE